MGEYEKFLESKVQISLLKGLECIGDYRQFLKPHQQDIFQWALSHGRGLIAASFGLGKTRIEIALMSEVYRHTGMKTLTVCPLGVRHQFTEEDGPKMGIQFEYVRTDEEAEESKTPFLITNYERIREGDITPKYLGDKIGGCSLDEGSVLRSLGSDTQLSFTEFMKPVPYRFVATATPSPNNYREIIYYAEYLGIMDHGQSLTRWFKRDSAKAGNLTLHPHLEKEFWLWVSSWALFIEKPSDLGHDDAGYLMPPMKVIWHKVASDHSKAWGLEDSWGQKKLLMDSAASVSDSIKEKRNSLHVRIAKAAEIIESDDPETHWIVWHHLESERNELQRTIPGIVSVWGNQTIEERESRILDFIHGSIRVFGSKPELNGQGCNLQYHCHKAIFVGIRFQFEEFLQAVHRIWRYMQNKEVEIHIIYTDAEAHIKNVLLKKWENHRKLISTMTDIVKKYGLVNEALKTTLQRSIGTDREEASGEGWTLVKNDCVDEVKRMGDNSVDLIHTSIPFGNHYEYSANYNDFGCNPTDDDFWKQMDFLIPGLYRVLKPGRIAAIHAKDRLLYGHQNGLGVMSISPFSDDCVKAFSKHGFIFFGRITVVTDVVRENSSTYRLGWTENSKDSTKMGVGMPEYVLLFRKRQTDISRAYADEPVTKDKAEYMRSQWQIDAHSFWRSSGDRLIRPEEIEEMDPESFKGMEIAQVYRWFKRFSQNSVYDYDKHIKMGIPLEKEGRLPSSFMTFAPEAPAAVKERDGSSVWTDVNFMKTLNTDQSRSRIENHVCPLSFDIVERIINRYSNPGELIFDPFSGLGTVLLLALRMGRNGYGVELAWNYWQWSVRYLMEEEQKRAIPSLFNFEEQSQHADSFSIPD